jgi:hypothetical protein
MRSEKLGAHGLTSAPKPAPYSSSGDDSLSSPHPTIYSSAIHSDMNFRSAPTIRWSSSALSGPNAFSPARTKSMIRLVNVFRACLSSMISWWAFTWLSYKSVLWARKANSWARRWLSSCACLALRAAHLANLVDSCLRLCSWRETGRAG